MRWKDFSWMSWTIWLSLSFLVVFSWRSTRRKTITNCSTGQPLVGDRLSAAAVDYFFVKCGQKFERIYFRDILYIEALQNYVTIFTLKGKYITLLPLKNVEQNLSNQSFIRVHKSFIVSISKIEAIENNEIILQSARIPISRNYRDHVIEHVVNDKLWKK